jgi:hypothetical protein
LPGGSAAGVGRVPPQAADSLFAAYPDELTVPNGSADSDLDQGLSADTSRYSSERAELDRLLWFL